MRDDFLHKYFAGFSLILVLLTVLAFAREYNPKWKLGFFGTPAAAAGAASAQGAGGSVGGGGATAVAGATPVERGANIFKANCASCHGERGEGRAGGTRAPQLSNQDFLALATDAFITQTITRGRPDTPMPAWGQDQGGSLSQENIADVVAFLRTWQKEPKAELPAEVKGSAQNGSNLFTANCAGCHGWNAEGDVGPAIGNKAFLEAATDGYIKAQVERGRLGTQMPQWKGQLKEQDVNDIVAFLRSLQNK